MKPLSMILGAGLLAFAGQANATVTLYLQQDGVNGGAVTQIGSDNGSGMLSYTGAYGNFKSTISAVGSPTMNGPDFLTQSINVSGSAAGTLTLYLVQTGLTGLSGNLLSTFTANSFMGNVMSVVESTYLGTHNEAYGGIELASKAFTGIGTATSLSNAYDLAGPFSETAKYVVTVGSGQSSVNNTINISGAVPEPASWAMMLGGFGLIGGALRRRQRVSLTFA